MQSFGFSKALTIIILLTVSSCAYKPDTYIRIECVSVLVYYPTIPKYSTKPADQQSFLFGNHSVWYGIKPIPAVCVIESDCVLHWKLKNCVLRLNLCDGILEQSARGQYGQDARQIIYHVKIIDVKGIIKH
jgi:hypothetical protein